MDVGRRAPRNASIRAPAGLLRNLLRQAELHVPLGGAERSRRVLPRAARDRRDRGGSAFTSGGHRCRRSLVCSIAPQPAAAFRSTRACGSIDEADLHDLGAAAHARRMQLHPRDDVTYVIDTTINYTNVCNVHCTFCAFFRPEHHKEGYTMSHDQVLDAREVRRRSRRDADHDSRRRQPGARR